MTAENCLTNPNDEAVVLHSLIDICPDELGLQADPTTAIPTAPPTVVSLHLTFKEIISLSHLSYLEQSTFSLLRDKKYSLSRHNRPIHQLSV